MIDLTSAETSELIAEIQRRGYYVRWKPEDSSDPAKMPIRVFGSEELAMELSRRTDHPYMIKIGD